MKQHKQFLQWIWKRRGDAIVSVGHNEDIVSDAKESLDYYLATVKQLSSEVSLAIDKYKASGIEDLELHGNLRLLKWNINALLFKLETTWGKDRE